MADDTEENEKYFGELFDKIGRGKLELWLKELKDKETQTSQTTSGATQPGGLEALLNSLLSEQKTENKTLKAKLETVMDLLTPEQRTPVTLTARRRGRVKLTDAERADRAAAREKEKAGSKATRKEPDEFPSTSIEQLKMLLASGHSIMATALQMPEIVLSEPEADALAKSSANVLKYYGPIGMGGKAGAWMSLVTTMGMIYVPRVLALVRRKKEFEQARKNRPLEERPIPPEQAAQGPMQ